MRSTDTRLPQFSIRPYLSHDYATLAALIEASYDYAGADVVPSQHQVDLLERVGELRKVESRANFVVAKRQSHDQPVEATNRPSMGCNFAFS